MATTARTPNPRSGATRRAHAPIARLLLVVIALLPGIGEGKAYLAMFDLPGNIDPFTDAMTYLAAGERLNDGHHLYSLEPGDRPVLIVPGQFSAPLVSPPTIAVIWRPIAAIGGFQLWIVATWLALLGAVAYLVWRTGLIGVVLAFVLAEPIGNQLAIANVTAFFPALLIIAWTFRRSPAIAAIFALMAAIKLAPGAMFGWSRILRDPRALAWAAASAVVIGLVAIGGAGVENSLDYPSVLQSTSPSPMSLSGLSGIPWLTTAVLILGTIAAAAIRSQTLSFVVAVVTLVAGTPALYLAGLVPLLAVLAPLAEARFDERALIGLWRAPGARSAFNPSAAPPTA